MSPKFASTTSSDADKTREQLLAELGEFRSQNAVLKESRAKSTNIQNQPGNRVEEEFCRANRALKALSECKEAMIRAGDEAVLLNDICRIIVDIGGYRMAWIGYIENDEVKTVRPVARAGYDEGYVDNLKIALKDPVRGNGPTGISLKTGKPYGSRNVRSDEEMRPWREDALKRGYLSTLNLPIVYEKQVIGALVIYSGKVDAFDEEERRLLFELAQTLAYGITAMRDRARRIRAERELKLANEELERRVEERTVKLSDSEGRFHAFMNNSPAIAWTKDEHGRYIFLNKPCENHFKIRLEDWLGKTDFEIFPQEIAEQLRGNDLEVLASGRLIEVVEETPNPDGSCSYWLSYKFPFKDTSGKKYVGGIAVDITERKRAEEELVEAKMQAELYLDLMGHDINNMNQIALGYLELAVEMVKDDKVRDIVKKPLDAIQNSSKLIENVRKLQKVRTGGLKIEAIDLDGLLVELKDQYLNVPGKDVFIDYAPRRDCYVMANGLLRDVFANLIGNAIKHSGPSKSVRIGLGLDRVKEDGREYCRVIVEDDGPGIPDVQKEKVFERFRKENAKAGGKGLGLYLVKSLVDDFHGKVHVDDRVPGDYTRGARFVVILPATEK